MNNYAIITGLDHYEDESWALKSAVKDALRFASWAIRRGGVKPENIRLLLSSTSPQLRDRAAIPDTELSLPVIKATSESMRLVLYPDMPEKEWGPSSDRLYFYYAGHGCSHPYIRRAENEPVLIFPDVLKLPLHADHLLTFSNILGALRGYGPKEQFYFMDACQDFALDGLVELRGVSSGLYFGPPAVPDGAGAAKQFVIYATSPGQRSNETKGKGVFGAALLQALKGDPRAPQRIAGLGSYELRFDHLFRFVQAEVQRAIAGIEGATKFIQVPEHYSDKSCPDPLVLSFSEEEIEEVDLTVRVSPEAALSGSLTVLYEGSPKRPPIGPPLYPANVIKLRPAFYMIEAAAPAFVKHRTAPFLHPGKPLEVTLSPLTGGAVATAAELPKFPYMKFHISDDMAVIGVTGPGGYRKLAQGNVSIDNPKAGFYLVRVMTPEGAQAEQAFEYPDASGLIELQPPLHQIGPIQLAQLRAAGVEPVGDGALEPSREFGANAKPASLLGFAAFAAYTHGPEWGARLRNFGLEPIPAEQMDGAWLSVLLSVEIGEPEIAAFQRGSNVALYAGNYTLGRFRPLPGYPAAAQYLATVPEGNVTVEVRLPEIPPTRFPLTCLRGRIATLCLNVTAEGKMDVQIYLIPFDGQQMDNRTLRVLEQAQRFYSGSEQMPDVITNQQLLTLKSLDPLLGCVVGYTLVRQGKASQFLGSPRPGLQPGEWNEASPMQNMLVNFPLLPDSHVLAGLCDREKQEEHFTAAIKQGIPLFTEGFRVLVNYFPPHSSQMTTDLWHARRTLAAGSAFSTWLGYEPALPVEQGSFAEPPFVWLSLDKHRGRINRQLQAVGAVLLKSEQVNTYKTGFLVAPDLVLTADHAIDNMLDTSTTPPTLRPDASISFLPSDSVEDPGVVHAIHSLVKIDHPARLALLLLAKPIDGVDPLRLAPVGTRPKPDQTVYLIGYPFLQTDLEEALVAHVFGARVGGKRVQPGYVVSARADKRSFDHDAFTLGGSAGSPVIDMETGLVLGLHWGSMDQSNFRRGRATGFWNAENRASLRDAGVALD